MTCPLRKGSFLARSIFQPFTSPTLDRIGPGKLSAKKTWTKSFGLVPSRGAPSSLLTYHEEASLRFVSLAGEVKLVLTLARACVPDLSTSPTELGKCLCQILDFVCRRDAIISWQS